MEVDLHNVQTTGTREILSIVASEIDAVSEGNIKLMIVIFLQVLVLSAQHAAAVSMLLTALSMLLRHIDSIFSSSFGCRSSMLRQPKLIGLLLVKEREIHLTNRSFDKL